jgi:HNH endonuclease/AP2 domain
MSFPPLEKVREALRYENGGKLYWREDRPRSHFASERAYKTYLTKHANREAGHIHTDLRSGTKRCMIRLCNQLFSRSVLVWALFYGWPNAEIDHADRNPLNDDIDSGNLRIASRSENAANRDCFYTSTSGRKGVSWHKASKKWQVRIQVQGLQMHVGLYDTMEKAHDAYVAKAKQYFGPFACG